MNSDPTPAAPADQAGNQASSQASNLRLRIIWGTIAGAGLAGCTWGGPVSFGLFFGGVSAIMLKEFYRIMRASGQRPASWLGGIAGGLIFVWMHCFTGYLYYARRFGWPTSWTFYPPPLALPKSPALADAWASLMAGLQNTGYLWLAFSAGLMTALLIREIIRWPHHGQPFLNLAATLAGLFYVSLPMSLLNTLAFHGPEFQPRYVFAFILLIWGADTGGYIAGRLFGRRKLAPNISPGKTWEGWAGGLALALFAGWVVAGWLLPAVPLSQRLVAAGMVAVFGPLGDLAESMLKRSAGVKDSGSFLPGHGGLLDRFDAFLLVLPVLALLQALFS